MSGLGLLELVDLQTIVSSMGEGPDGELPLGDAVTTFRWSPSRDSRWIYVTKWQWLSEWVSRSAPTFSSIERRVLSDGEFARRAGALIADKEVFFVGDLDPIDIAVYLSLVASMTGSKVTFGVSDEWLARATTMCRNPRGLPEMPLTSQELILWTKIRQRFGPELGAIPARVHRLLDVGRKLEIEGLTNPAFYRDGYLDEVRAALLGGGWMQPE